MSRTPTILFLQKRSHRAGAQTSLARILGSRTLSHLNPAVVLGETGWLSTELTQRSVPNFTLPYPSPRALATRIFGLKSFARQACRELSARDLRPLAVVANDHQECPLALAVAQASQNIPVIGLLRSAAMSERDFRKYRCADCDTLLCVGEVLQEKVRAWTNKKPELMEEGFTDHEFQPLQKISPEFPARILVIGHEAPAKGFTDFIQAMDWIEENHPDFPPLQCDFTGSAPRKSELLLKKRRRTTFSFLGRIDDLPARVRDYPLAVHPSRAETFGMAPIEALLAGIPALASSTGIVSRLDILAPFRFPPNDFRGLASKLVEVWQTWPSCWANLPEVRQSLRDRFHIDQTTQTLNAALKAIGIP